MTLAAEYAMLHVGLWDICVSAVSILNSTRAQKRADSSACAVLQVPASAWP